MVSSLERGVLLYTFHLYGLHDTHACRLQVNELLPITKLQCINATWGPVYNRIINSLKYFTHQNNRPLHMQINNTNYMTICIITHTVMLENIQQTQTILKIEKNSMYKIYHYIIILLYKILHYTNSMLLRS